MKNYFFFILIALVALSPSKGEAHRSGCHRWHTCPSDTGSYEMDYWPSGGVKQFCGSKMYMGTDGHCHYYTTPGYYPTDTTSTTQTVYSCTTKGLLEKYNDVKASGENMSDLKSKEWWNSCPEANRKSVFESINQKYSFEQSQSSLTSQPLAPDWWKQEQKKQKQNSSPPPVFHSDFSAELQCLKIANASWDYIKDRCFCDIGYQPSLDKKSCISDIINNLDYYFSSSSKQSFSSKSVSDITIRRTYGSAQECKVLYGESVTSIDGKCSPK